MGFCRSTRKGRYSRIGRVARTIQARRAAGGEVQARYKTELSAEDYVSSKAWWHANPSVVQRDMSLDEGVVSNQR